ncbi:MAG: oligoendopeptidase F, partial [Lachnospiraceae bacterium]|nr:oligoendopeptidase F [Lachnospiraceae bacterium]
MPKELVSRKEVPVKETWDLSLIYETEEAMQADLEKVKKLTAEVVTRFKGNLTTPETINACLDEMQEINRLVGLIINYTDLNASVDYCDAHLQEVNATVQMAISELFSKLSFVESEISRAEETVIRKAMEQSEDNRFYLDDILRYKPFQLDPETERVLAALSPVLNAPYNLYNTTKLADIQFENFEANGTSHPLGYSLFEDHYEFEPDTETRRAA